jgi:poly-gamma-glutamate biosynthesis protein PgsC/CapC
MIENLFVGLLISSLFIELVGVYPGGIIVPAYLGLYFDQPLRIVGTLVVSLVCFGSYKILSCFTILFGRRRFVVLILLGCFWLFIWNRLFIGNISQEFYGLHAVGLVIPGIIANTYERQGIALSIISLIVATTMTYFIVKLIFTLT